MTQRLLFSDVSDELHVAIDHRIEQNKIVRRVLLGDTKFLSSMDYRNIVACNDVKGEWWRLLYSGSTPSPSSNFKRPLRTVDLFCGIGGLGLGVTNFCLDLGLTVQTDLIVDEDQDAIDIYALNHKVRENYNESVNALVDFRVRGETYNASFAYEPEVMNSQIAESVYKTDLVLAGPPCQGNSNFNNHTRYNDTRNSLYLTVPAFTVATQANMAIIENVPGVIHDKNQVVQVAQLLFESNGYSVESGILSAHEIGWPQTRRRHFLLARKDCAPIPLSQVRRALSDSINRSVWWAIADLEALTSTDNPLDEFATLQEVNQRRIAWLFDNDQYNLHLSERPKSHRNGTSYRSVYGRMRADEPAPTITTGFMTPGRGRFVHPTQRRTLTPHEAARLQGFPDTYRFILDQNCPPSRTKLARWIGNAVPMPLGHAAALAVIGVNPHPFLK